MKYFIVLVLVLYSFTFSAQVDLKTIRPALFKWDIPTAKLLKGGKYYQQYVPFQLLLDSFNITTQSGNDTVL